MWMADWLACLLAVWRIHTPLHLPQNVIFGVSGVMPAGQIVFWVLQCALLAAVRPSDGSQFIAYAQLSSYQIKSIGQQTAAPSGA